MGNREKYHTLKNKMKFESVTGKSTIYVDQDFRAQVPVYNMLQDIRKEADECVSVKGRAKGSKYPMHTNKNIAIGLFKEQMIKLILETNDVKRGKLLFELQEEMEEYILPQRKLPGKERKKNCIKNSQWLNSYSFMEAGECRTEPVRNPRPSGVAVRGSVIEADKDRSRLRLVTDGIKENPESTHLYPVYYAGSGKGYSV